MSRSAMKWWAIAVLLAVVGGLILLGMFVPPLLVVVIWMLPLLVAVYWASAVSLDLREIKAELRAVRREQQQMRMELERTTPNL